MSQLNKKIITMLLIILIQLTTFNNPKYPRKITNSRSIYNGITAKTSSTEKADFLLPNSFYFGFNSINKSNTGDIKPPSKVLSISTHLQVPALKLSADDRERIERILMTSCGTLENLKMAKANAQVILDRTNSGRFGKNVNEVICAPGQFEVPWKGQVSSTVKDAVTQVFDRGERVINERVFYYINPNLSEISQSVWKKGKRYVATIGRSKYIHQYWTDKK